MENKNVKQRLYNSRSQKTIIPYKRLFISGGGKEFSLHFLDTSLVDPEGNLFTIAYLHGGFFHPNYDHEYPSTFRCGGKDCPLCLKAKEEDAQEKAANLENKDKQAWKKRCRRWALYWAVNLETEELTLVHVPASAPKGKESVQDFLFNELVQATEDGLNPFAFKDGNVVNISSKKVDGRDKFYINVDRTKHSVDEKFKDMMEKVKILKNVYKEYSKEHLQCVADEEPIVYNQDQNENNVKNNLKKTNQEAEDESYEEVDPETKVSDELLDDDGEATFFEDEESFDTDVASDEELDDKLNNLFSDDED